MKVLTGFFNSESNEHTYRTMSKKDFIFSFGEECIAKIGVTEVFEKNGITLIPSVYANGHPGGLIEKETFEEILAMFLKGVKEHLHEIDGIFLYLHGASKVIDLPEISAEHVILREIRKLVGKFLPIAVVMDPHGNVTEEFVEQTAIVRCYRHSPHIDIQETFEKTAALFCECLLNRNRELRPICRKLPLMVGGERSVSFDEPVRSINKRLDVLEKDPRIISASFHVGYVRHNSDKLGSAVVVVPYDQKFQSYAQEKAEELVDFILERRYQFHYHGKYGELADVLETVLYGEQFPAFITDSGDNCGAGSDGESTVILREILTKHSAVEKKILIAGIVDEPCYRQLAEKEIGEQVTIELGTGIEPRAKVVQLTGSVVSKGVAGSDFKDLEDRGGVIGIQLNDKPITVLVEQEAISFTEMDQFKIANVTIEDYDIIVVKQGYISPDFAAYGKTAVMALTEGPTYQATENLSFKQIRRPMFPYDELNYPIVGEIEGSFPRVE